MPYEFLPQDDMGVKVTGGTRAGLLVAATHGMFAVAQPKTEESDETRVERPFDLKAKDFPSLLAAFLEEAIKLSNERRETYDEVRFELITDKVAKGQLEGRPCLSFKSPVSGVKADIAAEKNPEGLWEAVIRFDGV